eukprot:CAMPEP_0117584252 /NCGR_PEP_ID=MMETSP0784-20121206/67489_1 /TAXON_ID=39447 /ORGANISM="" /LENGTH=46 /DNA_ID= /DNA_START= /DNA_END= /DNA_ORIENTATION=
MASASASCKMVERAPLGHSTPTEEVGLNVASFFFAAVGEANLRVVP